MTAKLTSLVDRAAATLGGARPAPVVAREVLPPGVRDDIATWLGLLEQWNARIDLTAARTPEELVDLMIADALVLAPHLAPGARLVDIGSGAGAPGLGLALLRRDLRVTLVEPLGKRASFLRTVLGTVGRADVAIERVRGEALAGTAAGPTTGTNAWDAAVSRATLAPAQWLEMGTKLAEPGGAVWVLVATEPPPVHPRAALDIDLTYAWPLTGAARRALCYRVIPTKSVPRSE
jgi:16S rRNA (guanine527-N7)-methyltransferase